MLRVPTWYEDIVYPQVFIPCLAEEKESKPSVHGEQHPNTLFATCTIWTFSAARSSRPTGFIRKHRGLNNWKWNTNHVTGFLQQPFRHLLGVEVDKGTSRMTAMSVSAEACYRSESILFRTTRFYISTDLSRCYICTSLAHSPAWHYNIYNEKVQKKTTTVDTGNDFNWMFSYCTIKDTGMKIKSDKKQRWVTLGDCFVVKYR